MASPWGGLLPAADLDDPLLVRTGGRDALSLALIASRNTLLSHLALLEDAQALRAALRAGAWQERWICSHVQRGRGEACDPDAPRLAGLEPRLQVWLEPQAPPPEAASVRAYLQESLEVTLDLLRTAADTDDGLHFFRLALMHEDRLAEDLAERLVETHDLGVLTSRPRRQPLGMPAQRVVLGSPRGGLVPLPERWAHVVAVPEFEIDAQPVDWDAFLAFAEDGGYDRAELWTPEGWRWAQDQGRRAPTGVEQLAGAVVALRGGRLVRLPGTQPVVGVSRHEAQAWCRWAGRRLPTEPEWTLAATRAASRGFAWGEVLEWVAGSARPWPGAPASAPGSLEAFPAAGTQGVLRGAWCLGARRARHPQARRFADPGQGSLKTGFRSCAV